MRVEKFLRSFERGEPLRHYRLGRDARVKDRLNVVLSRDEGGSYIQ